MCMNCGCGQPHDDHGKAENITLEDLQQAGAANGQSLRESAQHILETAQLVQDKPASDRGLAQPAAQSGGAAGGNPQATGGRGTPASES
ncbi:MAG TPA: hypothetical protein VHL56_03385 [Candidatus Limnocylindrales bacterium]|jgi:hypothetical protein|nr:hypothetical protein [Candidatus Limnocylindrales bacterium]